MHILNDKVLSISLRHYHDIYQFYIRSLLQTLWEKEKNAGKQHFPTMFPTFPETIFNFQSHSLFCRQMLSIWTILKVLSFGKELTLSQTTNLRLKNWKSLQTTFSCLMKMEKKFFEQVENTVGKRRNC